MFSSVKMFDQYQDQPPKEKPDEWFYPTIIVAALTIISLTVFALNYADLVFVSSLFSRGRKVEGEIVIATKEQPRVKLESVKVCAIREEKILGWINSKNEKAATESKKAQTKLDYARYAKAWAERDYKAAGTGDERSKAESVRSDKTSQFVKAESDYRYWFSPGFYFNGLKECDSQALTDSGGRFSLTLKEGKYALAAQAERGGGGGAPSGLKEEYFWLIWVTPENAARSIILNNDNLMTANPPERVMEIKDL